MNSTILESIDTKNDSAFYLYFSYPDFYSLIYNITKYAITL